MVEPLVERLDVQLGDLLVEQSGDLLVERLVEQLGDLLVEWSGVW